MVTCDFLPSWECRLSLGKGCLSLDHYLATTGFGFSKWFDYIIVSLSLCSPLAIVVSSEIAALCYCLFLCASVMCWSGVSPFGCIGRSSLVFERVTCVIRVSFWGNSFSVYSHSLVSLLWKSEMTKLWEGLSLAVLNSLAGFSRWVLFLFCLCLSPVGFYSPLN